MIQNLYYRIIWHTDINTTLRKVKDMKIFILMIFVLIFAITPAFAELDLSNELIKSTDGNLILQFEDNTIRYFSTHVEVTPHLEFGLVDLGNFGIQLDDARVNVLGSSFTIKNDNIALYAKNIGDNKFRINAYIFTDSGLQKTTFTASITPPEPTIYKTPEIIIEETEVIEYRPELLLTTSHDFKTYWKDTFNIDVQAFDGRINPNPTSSSFEGRLDGADITVLLSLDGDHVATINGITTNNGNWDGAYYFIENISTPGEYTVDVILTYLRETVSKSSSMFVIGQVIGAGSGNASPNANAGPDQSIVVSELVTLDGSGSSDPESDPITFLWSVTSEPSGSSITLIGETTDSPTFTASFVGTYTIQLVVSDDRGKSSTDSVEIVVS